MRNYASKKRQDRSSQKSEQREQRKTPTQDGARSIRCAARSGQARGFILWSVSTEELLEVLTGKQYGQVPHEDVRDGLESGRWEKGDDCEKRQ